MKLQQAFGSSAKRRRVALHLLASAHLSCAIFYDYNYAQLPSLVAMLQLEPPIGGKFKYLTFLSGLLQAFYYTLALAEDLLERKLLRRLRDYVMTSLVVPLAMTVSFTFWTLYAFDREAIYPKILDLVYPQWLNQTMHSCVLGYALLELWLTPHRFPPRRRSYVGLALMLSLYLVWLHWLWWHTGIWVYPFLEALSTPVRLLFFGCLIVLAFLYYSCGRRISLAIWTHLPADPKRLGHS